MSRLQNNDRIVIVGGGVIGLSTAYNLAKRSLESSPRIKIQVIEASDACFAASSSNCTGCFHYAFTDPALQPLLPLGEYSFNLWEAESVDPDFKAATGYRAQSSFGISTGTGKGLEGLPDWVTKDPTWDVDTSILGARTATVFVPASSAHEVNFVDKTFTAIQPALASGSNANASTWAWTYRRV